jgi:hypothetical protein
MMWTGERSTRRSQVAPSTPASSVKVWPSAHPTTAGYWHSRFERRPNVSLIWCGNKPVHEFGLRPRDRFRARSFVALLSSFLVLLRSTPRVTVQRLLSPDQLVSADCKSAYVTPLYLVARRLKATDWRNWRASWKS